MTPALRRTAIAAPLALSLFVLAGYRFLFRLPVELRANWLFRVNEPGSTRKWLTAVERFLLWGAVAPVALGTLLLEVGLLGLRDGAGAAALCLAVSMIDGSATGSARSDPVHVFFTCRRGVRSLKPW